MSQRQEVEQILHQYGIKSGDDYMSQSPEILAEIYENIKIVAEENALSDDEIDDILDGIFGE